MLSPRRTCAAAALAAAFAATGVGFATPVNAPTLTLAQALRMALAAHPDVRASTFDVFAAGEAVKIARSGYQPQVAGSAIEAVAPGETRLLAAGALNDPTVIQRGAVGVGISQYITDFGRTGDLVRAARADLQSQIAAGNATRDTVLLSATQAYIAVLRADSLLDVANATRRERDTLVRDARALFRSGLRSELDVSIAERDLSGADQLILQARDARLDAYAALAESIGTSDTELVHLAPLGPLPPLPPDYDALIGAALRASPDVAQAQAVSIAQAARAAASAALTTPTVTGYGYFGAAPFKESNTAISSPYAAAGIALNVPIYNGGELSAERRQARDLAEAAREHEVEARNVVVKNVRQALEDVRTARSNIDVTGSLLRTAERAFALTRARYRVGLSTIEDLSEAQLQEEQAAISQADATYDYVTQVAALEFAAGLIAGSNGTSAPGAPPRTPSRTPPTTTTVPATPGETPP